MFTWARIFDKYLQTALITRPHLRRVLHELNVGVEHDEDPGPAAAVLAVDHGRAAQLRPGEGVRHHAAEVEQGAGLRAAVARPLRELELGHLSDQKISA